MAVEHTEEMNLASAWDEPQPRNEPTREKGEPTKEVSLDWPPWSRRIMESKALMVSALGVFATLIALFSGLFSVIFSSGRGVANLATKTEIQQVAKDLGKEQKEAREKALKDVKEERRLVKQRVRVLESVTTRLDVRVGQIDARTKETNRNIQTLMQHFQLQPSQNYPQVHPARKHRRRPRRQ